MTTSARVTNGKCGGTQAELSVVGSKDKKEASFVPSEIPNQNLGTSPDFVLFDFGRDNFGRGVARAVYLLVSQSLFHNSTAGKVSLDDDKCAIGVAKDDHCESPCCL